MIVLKYVKLAESRFISHIDLLRHFTRILRRGDIEVRRSNGFHPHALVFFSPPLALSVASNAEYVAIDTPLSANEVFCRYNGAVPDTLRAICAYTLPSNPNLQGRVVAADYLFDVAYAPIDISDITIKYVKNGTCIQENASERVFGAREEDGKLLLTLALGGVNLRPDRMLPTLNERLGCDLNATDIIKLRQYIKTDGGLVDVDEFLSLAEKER